MQETTSLQQRKGRRMLLFLLVLFALPIVVVLSMYRFDYRPGGASHGELLTPPKPLRLPATHDLQGASFDAAAWKKKWHLVTIAEAQCAADCRERIHLLRQVHVTLNKEIERVQRILIVPQADTAELADLQRQYPDLVILTGSDAAALAKQFDLPAQPATTSGRAYVVDPLGNLIMSYPAGFDPKGLQKDMTRLLKYSWVG
jgi:hypothetical protein